MAQTRDAAAGRDGRRSRDAAGVLATRAATIPSRG
jgi:hypothetical protein